MKKVFLLAIIILLSATSCRDKEPDQISFSLKNLTTLLSRSGGYIEKASPGDISANEDEYLAFKIYNEISGIDVAMIFYALENDKSQSIEIFTETVNSFTISEKLITLADNELGASTSYYLEYYDANSELQEKNFASASSMWTFISANSVSVGDVETMAALYLYGDYYVMAGGYHYTGNTTEYYFPLLEIGLKSDITMKQKSVTMGKTGFCHFKNINLVK